MDYGEKIRGKYDQILDSSLADSSPATPCPGLYLVMHSVPHVLILNVLDLQRVPADQENASTRFLRALEHHRTGGVPSWPPARPVALVDWFYDRPQRTKTVCPLHSPRRKCDT